MITFYLYGELGEKFGNKWELDVKTVAEGIKAMFVNTKREMENYLRSHAEDYFTVKDGEYCMGEKIELISATSSKEIHIAPCVKGSGKVGQIILGVVLLIVGIFTMGSTTPYIAALGQGLFAAGASLTLGGIMQLLTPSPKLGGEEENKQSFFFNNGTTAISQGNSVPIGYGQMMVIGKPINVSLTSEPILGGSAGAPSSTVGGLTERVTYIKGRKYVYYDSTD